MNKINTLKSIIAILLIINIALLAIPFFRGGPGGAQSDKRALNHVKKHFSFDDAQMEEFGKAKDIHSTKMEELRSTLDELSTKYFNLPEGPEKQQILQEMENASTAIITNTDQHFNDIRKICREDQLPKMEGFIKTLMQKKRPGHPRKKEKTRKKR